MGFISWHIEPLAYDRGVIIAAIVVIGIAVIVSIVVLAWSSGD